MPLHESNFTAYIFPPVCPTTSRNIFLNSCKIRIKLCLKMFYTNENEWKTNSFKTFQNRVTLCCDTCILPSGTLATRQSDRQRCLYTWEDGWLGRCTKPDNVMFILGGSMRNGWFKKSWVLELNQAK